MSAVCDFVAHYMYSSLSLLSEQADIPDSVVVVTDPKLLGCLLLAAQCYSLKDIENNLAYLYLT